MIGKSKVAVVMPAYDAEETIERTVRAIDRTLVDDIILVDDQSHDQTATVAQKLGLFVHVHPENLGYGGNQKSCYRLALTRGADIVVMVHPDYQYDPRLVPAMAHMIHSGLYDVVLGSRILGTGALAGGMPLVKFIANRFLTAFQNLVIRQKQGRENYLQLNPKPLKEIQTWISFHEKFWVEKLNNLDVLIKRKRS